MSTIANHNRIDSETNTYTVILEGNILSTNAHDVRAQLAKALGDPRSAAGVLEFFELDITSAQMIDSVGLNLIVWLLKAVRERRASLRLLVASVHVQRTLQFTRLDQQMELVSRS